MDTKIVYYRKSSAFRGMKQISLLEMQENGKLKDLHKYTSVSSWKAAKEILKTRHDTDKVHESSDMFKVYLKEATP